MFAPVANAKFPNLQSLGMRLYTLGFLVTIVLTMACGPKQASTNNSTPAPANVNTEATVDGAKTSAEELGNLITMPFEAQDVVWKQSKDQKRIVAVIRFDPEDTQKLAAECQKFGPVQNGTVDAQTWFPDDLTAQSDLHGDEPLSGKAYAANPFFQDPYNTGRVVRVNGTDYYVVELTSQ